MKKSISALMATLTTGLCTGPVLAQDFLSPVTPQAPTFASNGALNSGGAVGNASNSSGLLTGAGAIAGQTLGGRSYSLPSAQNGLIAPSSVNNAPLPTDNPHYTYGFSSPPAFSIYPGASNNQYGMYAGQALPYTSTGSVDINTVDCPYLRESYGSTSSIVNPLNLNINIPGLGTLNLQESPQSAVQFIDQSVNDISSFFGGSSSLLGGGSNSMTPMGGGL
jgi:hypothetical protein